MLILRVILKASRRYRFVIVKLVVFMNSIRTSFTTISLLVLLIFSCIAYVANAQTSTEPTPQERFEALQAERETTQTERQEERASSSEARVEAQAETAVERQEAMAERRAALSLRQQERFTNLAANISNRKETVITRLSNINDRLIERAAIMADEGFDVTEAEIQIAAAANALDEASVALINIDGEVAVFVSSANPREAWLSTRSSYVETRASIQAARASIREALASLKSAASETTTGVKTYEVAEHPGCFPDTSHWVRPRA